MTHHPHVHMIVPGGGIAPDGSRWVSSRPAFLLPVRVLGGLFRRLFLTRLIASHDARRLSFFRAMAHFTAGAAAVRTSKLKGRANARVHIQVFGAGSGAKQWRRRKLHRFGAASSFTFYYGVDPKTRTVKAVGHARDGSLKARDERSVGATHGVAPGRIG